MAHKEACLQRTIDIHGHQGGFGFSVLGGAGTKFPAVVCEVDTGGPAALSGKVNVGDQLVTVNGEELSKLSPKECEFIRSSPHVEGRRNSRDVSAKRESRQSIESYKNETETTTTEVAIIGFEEKPIEHSSDSSTPRPSSDGSSHSESFQERPRSADISSAEVTRRSPKKKPQATHTSYVDAVGMARRLYMMDGYRKSEVAEKLADMSEFGKTVAKEYLKFFEFDHTPLDIALREFLTYFSLTGESQERERVIQHFSQRYHECNPTTFSSEDVVHGMTVALLLLNTDLHGTHDGERMTFNQFIRNLEGIDVKLPKETLKKFYDSIKSNALQWALDDEVEKEIGSSSSLLDPPEQTETVIMHHVTIPGTFVEVQLPSNALLFKEGYIRKKNIMEGPHKKVARGKRQWKAYHAVLKGFMLYFTAPQGELNLDDTSSAIAVTHCLAIRDPDYQRKEAVFRFTTPDWQAYLIQANSISEMLQWIGAINKSAATYSSPPLAAAVGSGNAAFHRPTFPLAPTKNTVEEQIACHESRVASLEKELQELESYKPDKKSHNAIQDWFDRREFVQFEINRFRIYLATLTNPQFVDFSAPLPSGLVPSPSISTLAAMGTGNSMSESFRTETPPPSLSPRTEHRKRPIVPMKK